MLELLLCAIFTILPDYLYRRYVQGKRLGHEITLFSVWYELRWGITSCLILTILLLTMVFYFHPMTKSVASVFRTVTILPETGGRVAEIFVDINQKVAAGQPLFRLDNTAQKAAVEANRRKIAEVEANMVVAQAQLKEAEGRIAQALGAFQQAKEEYDTRAELMRRNPAAISQREVDRLRIRVETEQGQVDAARAAREAVIAQIEFQFPAQKASAEAALASAQVDLDKTLVVAGTDGIVQQFTLRAGDVVNPMLRPAGILVPERLGTALIAGFDQIEAEVLKVGMLGEVTCIAKPWTIIPVVVTQVQDVIASGQFRPTDQLVDVQQFARPGTITAFLEPVYQGALDGLPQGANCIAVAYTNNHNELESGDISASRWLFLHAVDAVAFVKAALLRIQALLLPIQKLVLTGH
jgi:multidrug resistance efflux pump